jgi:UDP-glucose-4-epimerase GalE
VKSQIPILVTGGAGYIGSHACKELARLGYLPITYDNLSTGHRYAVQWGPLIQADLADTKALDLAFFKYKPKAVLHFAGSSILMESVYDPKIYYRNNVCNTVHLLEAMKKHDSRFLVFSSTCASYGIPDQIPITEEHPQNPISPYGKSKWMIEQILQDFEQAYSIHSVSLRYFNAAGADFDLEIGEHHEQETHIIPLAIFTALGMRELITIYGNDFPTFDGTAIRDYIHVADLASAHVSALEWMFKNEQSNVINLGTSNGFSVKQIIQAVEEFSESSISVAIEKKRQGEPAVLIADTTKAKNLLNWNPRHSDLSTIIQTAWKWHRHLLQKEKKIKKFLKQEILQNIEPVVELKKRAF